MILPQHLAERLAEARRLMQAGQLQPAAQLYNELINEEPNAAEAWAELTTLLVHANHADSAIKCCHIWRSRVPNAGRPMSAAHHLLGCHLYEHGRTAEALAAMRTAVEVEPDLMPAWRSIAALHLQEERAGEALPVIREALTHAPTDPETRFMLAFALDATGDSAAALPIAEALAAAEPANPRYHYFIEDLLLRADEGEETFRRNDAFHARIEAEMRKAAAGGKLEPLLLLERHLVAQADASAAWECYSRIAEHADFKPEQRSSALIAKLQIDSGALLPQPGHEALPERRAALAAPLVSRAAKRLVMLLLVRDEADIIRETIACHLNQGVDTVIVTDNGSVDGTRDLLADMERELPLLVLDEPGRSFEQDLWTTRMGYLAADIYRADWIFSADADEFWLAESGDIPAAIAADAAHYGPSTNLLTVPALMMVPDRDAAAAADFRPIETRRLFRQPLGNARAVSRWPTAWPLHRQATKMLFRGEGFVALWPGNHYAVMERPHFGFARHLTIHHFHFRSFAHLQRKVAMTHAAMKDNPQWQDVVRDLDRKLARDRAGMLLDGYRRATWPTELYRAAADAGRLVETDRILEIAGRPPPPLAGEDDDPAALRDAARRYIDEITPLVPRFRRVALGSPAGR